MERQVGQQFRLRSEKRRRQDQKSIHVGLLGPLNRVIQVLSLIHPPQRSREASFASGAGYPADPLAGNFQPAPGSFGSKGEFGRTTKLEGNEVTNNA